LRVFESTTIVVSLVTPKPNEEKTLRKFYLAFWEGDSLPDGGGSWHASSASDTSPTSGMQKNYAGVFDLVVLVLRRDPAFWAFDAAIHCGIYWVHPHGRWVTTISGRVFVRRCLLASF